MVGVVGSDHNPRQAHQPETPFMHVKVPRRNASVSRMGGLQDARAGVIGEA